MNARLAIPTRTRIAGLFFSIVMSTAVLGATVLSMQPRYDGASPQLVALERVVISAPAVN
jgi:hypothetical protein